VTHACYPSYFGDRDLNSTSPGKQLARPHFIKKKKKQLGMGHALALSDTLKSINQKTAVQVDMDKSETLSQKITSAKKGRSCGPSGSSRALA
jgi:hypothetical protein